MHICMDEINALVAVISGIDIVVIRHFMRIGWDRFVGLWIVRA